MSEWLACVLCEKIESVRANTFRDDRDIDGGDDIPDAIRRAIDDSDELLVFPSTVPLLANLSASPSLVMPA